MDDVGKIRGDRVAETAQGSFGKIAKEKDFASPMGADGERAKAAGGGGLFRSDENRTVATAHGFGLYALADPTVFEDGEMGEEAGHVFRPVGDHEERPLPVDVGGEELAPEEISVIGIESGQGLVEEGKLGVEGEEDRGLDAREITPGQRREKRVVALKTGRLEMLRGARTRKSGVYAVVEVENVADAEAGGHVDRLGAIGDPEIGTPASARIVPKDEDLALAAEVSGKGAQKRAFPCAVASDEKDERPFGDLEIEAVEGTDMAVGLTQPFALNGERHDLSP